MGTLPVSYQEKVSPQDVDLHYSHYHTVTNLIYTNYQNLKQNMNRVIVENINLRYSLYIVIKSIMNNLHRPFASY